MAANETIEWEKYYYAGPVRLAIPLHGASGDFLREDSDSALYLITNHLGSTSLVIDTSGQEVARRSYLPFGETWGVSATELPTDYTYTGQREAAEIGLKYYVARWYDSEIGHFIQADIVVPGIGNPMAWNRYAYVKYNPIKYVDPSGHMVDEEGSYNPWKKTVSTDEGLYDLENDVWIQFYPPFEIVSTSQKGLEFIEYFEGNVPEPYNDPAGNCTIGIGHLIRIGACTSSDFIDYEGFSTEDAINLLGIDIQKYEQPIRDYVFVSLTQAQFDALVSFNFNLGVASLPGSDLLWELNHYNYDQVPYQLSRWVNALNSNGSYSPLPGLVNRRTAEGILFSTGRYIGE